MLRTCTYKLVPTYQGKSVPVSVSVLRSTGLVTETDIRSEYQLQSLLSKQTVFEGQKYPNFLNLYHWIPDWHVWRDKEHMEKIPKAYLKLNDVEKKDNEHFSAYLARVYTKEKKGKRKHAWFLFIGLLFV